MSQYPELKINNGVDLKTQLNTINVIVVNGKDIQSVISFENTDEGANDAQCRFAIECDHIIRAETDDGFDVSVMEEKVCGDYFKINNHTVLILESVR